MSVNKLQEYKLLITVDFPSSVKAKGDLRDDKVYCEVYSRSVKKTYTVEKHIDYSKIVDSSYEITLAITDEMIRTIGKGQLSVDIVTEIFDPDFPDGYRTERYTLRTNIII